MNTPPFTLFLKAVEHLPPGTRILGDEDVVFPPELGSGYSATPLNALVFGRMGVDGVHYAILTENGHVQEDSPVVTVSPMDFESSLYVTAKDFGDYLATGCGVDRSTLEEVLRQEEEGQRALVPFLASNFDQSRLLEDESRVGLLSAQFLSKAVLQHDA
jgi:hypothetical protein